VIPDFKTQLDKPKPSQLRRHRHKLIVIGLSVLATALVLQFAADPEETTAATRSAPLTQELALPGQTALSADQATRQPDLNPAVVKHPEAAAQQAGTSGTQGDTDAAQATPATRWVEHRIRSGENLATIFKDIGLSAQLLYKITHSSDEAATLAHIRPGQTLRFELEGDHRLVRLDHVLDPITSLQIRAKDDGFSTREVRKDVHVRLAEASGTIDNSLFLDGQAAGLSDGQIMELANIFGWDIDFALELRKGDHFSLIYEEQYLDGKKFRNGAILAAEFINRGTSYRALRYEDADGNVGYYDPDGSSKRRAFLRTPVKFARISSGFTTRRWHPLLHKWRSHKGVDYAAPTGTPIKSTGAGRVVFRGWKGGYGRAVIIKHGVKYSTLYGHMSHFAKHVKAGTRVKQGQIIGYVGMSGLATGPHLHYEFRVNGVHRNPLTVKLPKSAPLPKAQLAKFQTSTAPLLARLDALEPPTLVAKADTSNP
jgi:murein DD-endopeptidase MepM/ murein hydrolase activator NlpD